MPKQTYRYKVSGTIKFFIDDIAEENETEAREMFDLENDVAFAAEKGNIELLDELTFENLGPCDRNKFYENREC